MGFIFAVTSRAGRVVAAFAGIGFHNFTRIFAGIGFDELMLCYPLLLDVDAGVRWLRARLRMPTAPALVRATPPSPPLVTVAAALMLGTALFGALRIGGAWAVACAPRFDTVHTPLYTSYVVSGRRPDGTMVHVRDGGLGGPAIGRRLRDLFRARQFHASGLEQPDGRERRWQVLCAFVWNHHPSLVDATDVRFTLVDVDLTDGSAQPRVLAQHELFRCDRKDDPGPR